MDAFSSPLRLIPPLTPRRAPSPTMSPGGRRGRTHGGSEEGRLRDLSPETTLRAFTQRPLPFDTSLDEYKIFSCIEALTAAERDLGARVAKAAQRLKSWCAEIEQWGWTGTFAQPSAAFREQRRRSLELRIREHIPDADLTKTLRPLEYWGSLLSDEVEQHEARLDDIEEEMLKLDVEELKEHVLDMHPTRGSRPSSAGFEATRQNYKPMDDFSFLITQTLLSALPHHAQLKDRLSTWTARVAILREVPEYMSELETAQKAVRLGWDALDPPADTSDAAFAQWKEAVDTISDVLQSKVGHLGRRLDRMLDTLEGREDCLPDAWIDVFEATEADFGRWAHDSRRRVLEFDVRRRAEQGSAGQQRANGTRELESHSSSNNIAPHPVNPVMDPSIPSDTSISGVRSVTAFKSNIPEDSPYSSEITTNKPRQKENRSHEANKTPQRSVYAAVDSMPPKPSPATTPTIGTPTRAMNASIFARQASPLGPTDSAKIADFTHGNAAKSEPLPFATYIAQNSTTSHVAQVAAPEDLTQQAPTLVGHDALRALHPEHTEGIQPRSSAAPETIARQPIQSSLSPSLTTDVFAQSLGTDLVSPLSDEESFFEEGDTVVHNEIDEDSVEGSSYAQISSEESPTHFGADNESLQSLDHVEPPLGDILNAQHKMTKSLADTPQPRFRPLTLADSPVIITSDGKNSAVLEPPQTPRSRRDSTSSLSSDMSFESSPTNFIEESPSIRSTVNRGLRAPRPELNAAMTKRRAPKSKADDSIVSTPWPPTRFTQKPTNGVDDLESKISDILTTIPTHIRLTSGPGADAPEVKPRWGVAHKDSRGYLRAARSASGMKSPELTLSPAKNDFDSAHVLSGRRSSAALRGDNDIKLYHLTQPGKEHPVKLFIRRVGENGERVMVRVGGGWADLGEYLRQYAEHHGRRTVSEGKFEIVGLEVKNPDNSPTRPESSMGKSGRVVTSPMTTPIKSSGPGFPSDGAPPAMPNLTPTPGIAEETSVPSTNSSQRSWRGDEVGLAGPKSKKLDLSGEKLEWIEGMMKQARTVSGSVITANHAPFARDERADSRSDSRSDSRTGSRAGARKSDFGDLGKVGGTKRIFLRGGQPSTGEH